MERGRHPDGPRLFDWTDAAISHPFLDLAGVRDPPGRPGHPACGARGLPCALGGPRVGGGCRGRPASWPSSSGRSSRSIPTSVSCRASTRTTAVTSPAPPAPGPGPPSRPRVTASTCDAAVTRTADPAGRGAARIDRRTYWRVPGPSTGVLDCRTWSSWPRTSRSSSSASCCCCWLRASSSTTSPVAGTAGVAARACIAGRSGSSAWVAEAATRSTR